MVFAFTPERCSAWPGIPSRCEDQQEEEDRAEARAEEIQEAISEAADLNAFKIANPGDHKCPSCLYRTLKYRASRCPRCQGGVDLQFWVAIDERAQKRKEASERDAELKRIERERAVEQWRLQEPERERSRLATIANERRQTVLRFVWKISKGLLPLAISFASAHLFINWERFSAALGITGFWKGLGTWLLSVGAIPAFLIVGAFELIRKIINLL